MKITLKNVKHYESMSEETNCFTATLYIDGKKACQVSNRGSGGANEYGDYSVVRLIDEYAKTLPKKSYDINGESFAYRPSADCLINEALNVFLKEKEEAKFRKMARKDYTTRLCYEKDGQMTATKRIAPASIPMYLDYAVKNGRSPLNLLPFDDFFVAWKRLVVISAQPTTI